jgi:hypothetical protein
MAQECYPEVETNHACEELLRLLHICLVIFSGWLFSTIIICSIANNPNNFASKP